MKPSYQYLEHTADVLFKAEAPTLGELFAQCALAVENAQINLSTVEAKEEKTLTGKNKDLERLLFDFLDDLLFYKDSEGLIFKEFQIKVEEKAGEYQFTCKAKGEKLDPQKHEQKVDAKAVTMHLFEVKQVKDGWTAQVLVDI